MQSIERSNLPIPGPGVLEPLVEGTQRADIVDPLAFIDHGQIRAAGEKILDYPAVDRPIAREMAVNPAAPGFTCQSPH
jgi:hypothetical protein